MSISRTNRAFAATTALSLLLVGFATTAQADDDPATLTLGAADTLTLARWRRRSRHHRPYR